MCVQCIHVRSKNVDCVSENDRESLKVFGVKGGRYYLSENVSMEVITPAARKSIAEYAKNKKKNVVRTSSSGNRKRPGTPFTDGGRHRN